MSCKKDNYKRLGDYILEVDVRNSAMEVNLSQGICNMKYFQNPRQVSSTPHLDKIVRTGQFAYNRATTRNGEKISIAYREGPDCTVSSAYCVFYITDEEVLNPYYLWLWFKRPDFDRYAIFKSHGSAHEFFEFETLCNTYVPMPPIEEQRRIVKNYLSIQKRIENNKQTIAKLEETAQAIYRKMFVDDIDPENLPEGWKLGGLSDIAEFLNGVACQKYETKDSDYYPVIKIREMGNGDIDENSDRVTKLVPSKYIIKFGDILFSWSASLLVSYWCGKTGALNQHIFKVIPKNVPDWYCYYSINNQIEEWNRVISAKAVSMGHIKREDLDEAKVVIPNDSILNKMDKQISPLINHILNLTKENSIQSVVLNALFN